MREKGLHSIVVAEDEQIILEDIIHKLIESLSVRARPYPVTLCMDNTAVPFFNIGTQAHKLRLTLEQGLIIGHTSVITPGEVNKSLPPSFINLYIEKRISKFIESREIHSLKNEIMSLFNQWKELQYPQRYVENALRQLVKLFRQKLISISEVEMYGIESRLYSKLATSYDFSSIYEDLWKEFEGMFISDKNLNDTTRQLVDNIETFIKTNFSAPLNLENIARNFNFTSSYLTKIFKRFTGETPIKYLTSLRIEEAKRLIENQPELDLKYVGEIVGYSDSHYFSRIFKSVTGMSPSEYKENTAKCNLKS